MQLVQIFVAKLIQSKYLFRICHVWLARGCIIIMHYIYICNIIISRAIIGRDNADHSIFLLTFSHRFVISQSLFRDLPVFFQSSFCHLYIIFLSSFCHYSVLVSFCLSVFLSVIAHLSSSNFI